jgi:hypothetical protein
MIRPKTLLLSLMGGGAGVICALMLSAGTAHAATPPTSQVGGVNANAPVSVSNIAVGVVGVATPSNGPPAAPSGGTATPSSTTQQLGLVNANAPVNVCGIAVGALGFASSGCGVAGPIQHAGLVNANAPVNVCGIAVGVLGRGSSECEPGSSTPHQGGLVNVNIPVSVCGGAWDPGNPGNPGNPGSAWNFWWVRSQPQFHRVDFHASGGDSRHGGIWLGRRTRCDDARIYGFGHVLGGGTGRTAPVAGAHPASGHSAGA